MLNVTRPPANYRRALGAFKQAFRNKRNFSSFVHMVFALIIIQAEWTVSNLSDRHSRPDQKARRAYNRFFTTAAWDQTALAQAMLSYVWSRLAIDDDDTLLLIIDDTFSRKFADATDGVGNFRNGSTGDVENGNVIVTSCLQYGGLYVPFQPVLYLGEDEAETLSEQFQTKLELAVEKIVKPLQSDRLERQLPLSLTRHTTQRR